MIPAAFRAVSSAVVGLALLAGCRRDAREPLWVFAASSLTETFEDLEATYEAAHPEVDVVLSFAGSQALRVQIEQGAQADVFASAAPVHMQALLDAGLVAKSDVMATNELVVVVPRDAASTIESFTDLARAERVVLGDPQVPVGIYARQLLERAGERYGGAFSDAVRSQVVSEEANVRLVLAKVELGEADAAIVYRTDAIASGKVRTIDVPAGLDVSAEYRLAILKNAPHLLAARDWVELVLGPGGREALERHGFAAPAARI